MIRAAVKRLVRSIYVMRCGYCLLSEVEIGAELTFDHFQPQTQGGSGAEREIPGGFSDPDTEVRELTRRDTT